MLKPRFQRISPGPDLQIRTSLSTYAPVTAALECGGWWLVRVPEPTPTNLRQRELSLHASEGHAGVYSGIDPAGRGARKRGGTLRYVIFGSFIERFSLTPWKIRVRDNETAPATFSP